jgi:high affinity Mn2+ porin
MQKLSLMSLVLFGCIFLSAAGAFALHPELAMPEKVEVRHKACQEIMRLGSKYQITGLFSKEFETGQVCYTRVEVAAALVLLTDKMAERVAKDGPAAVDKDDLLLLSDLQEELRGEMLLARSRAFQSRYGDLGTNFHALTKNITLSGGLVGVVQGTLGNKPKDHAALVGRGDLVFNFKLGESTIAVIDVEATGGDGVDAKVPSFSLLNGVAGSTGDRVRFREAWVEHAAFDDRLVMTVGKIDLTNYFDANSVANDENSQFLAGAFVNSAVLGAPAIGPGVRVQAKLAESLVFGVGFGSGDVDSADAFDHGYGIAELGFRLKAGELEGNYRVYGSVDGALPDGTMKLAQKNALGFGASIDQQFTEKLTLFGRYGQRDKHVYTTKMAWSVGGQYAGLIPERKDDVLAFAFGQIGVAGGSSPEKLAEFYYKVKVNDQIAIAPVIQYLINPEGDGARDNVVALGLRSQISF